MRVHVYARGAWIDKRRQSKTNRKSTINVQGKRRFLGVLGRAIHPRFQSSQCRVLFFFQKIIRRGRFLLCARSVVDSFPFYRNSNQERFKRSRLLRFGQNRQGRKNLPIVQISLYGGARRRKTRRDFEGAPRRVGSQFQVEKRPSHNQTRQFLEKDVDWRIAPTFQYSKGGYVFCRTSSVLSERAWFLHRKRQIAPQRSARSDGWVANARQKQHHFWGAHRYGFGLHSKQARILLRSLFDFQNRRRRLTSGRRRITSKKSPYYLKKHERTRPCFFFVSVLNDSPAKPIFSIF